MIDMMPTGLEKLTSEENDFSESKHLKSKSIAISLIAEAAKEREFKVGMYGRSVFEILNNEQRVVFLQNSPENSSVYSYCAKKKHIAKKIMARNGIPVPRGRVFTDMNIALSYFEKLECEVTVKPADGSHGSGVTTGISSKDDFFSAWNVAKTKSREVIVEQCIRGYDIRVIVIGGSAVAAYVRIPANVVGDGVSTIRQLIDMKNRRRKLNPSLRYDPLSRFDLLEREGRSLDDVPQNSERVWLTSVANTSVGGEAVQLIDQLSQAVLEIAERAAKAFPGLTQVGVDLMVDSSKGEDETYVLEVNSNPGISDAVFPSYGRPVDVPAALVDYVFRDKRGVDSKKTSVIFDPAAPCSMATDKVQFSKGIRGHVDLIKQAAFANNVAVENIYESIFSLSYETQSVTLVKGVPDKTSVISRKVTRSRDWMLDLLRREKFNVDQGEASISELSRYRLTIINNKLVAALVISESSESAHFKNFDGRKVSDVTEVVNPSFTEVAIRCTNAIFNPFIVGVDVFAEDISLDPSRQHWCISDATCNPFLPWHHFPDYGVGRNVAGALVRALFPELNSNQAPCRCVFVTLTGRVQGVGFRNWIKRHAVLHGVGGWVSNVSDGSLQILVEGTPVAVSSLIRLCKRGPSGAEVANMHVKEYAASGLRHFLWR